MATEHELAIETEAERLSSAYRSLEDTVDTDTLMPLREPVMQSMEDSNHSTLGRLRRHRVYDVLVPSAERGTPKYVRADAREDLIA